MKKMVFPCLIVLLLIPTYLPTSNVSADSITCNSSMSSTIDEDYKGGVFVDSYWADRSSATTGTTNPVEVEVSPAEGPSTLAVVLVNTSTENLFALTGYLELPKGFTPFGLSEEASRDAQSKFSQEKGLKAYVNAASASYPGTIAPGQTITLYFDVNITNATKVGTYYGSLIAQYSTSTLKFSCLSALLTIPFTVPGKVILDTVAENQYLFPKTSNTVTFSIINKGTADATGVVATILNLGESGSRGSGSGSSLTLQSSDTNIVNLGPNTFNIGTIKAGQTANISTVIFPGSAAASTVKNVDLQISYGNSYGYKKTVNLTTGLVISPTPAESSLIISSTSEKSPPTITAGKVENYGFSLTNSGQSPLTDIVISLTGESESLKIVGNSKWSIDMLEPGATKYMTSDIFAATSLINSPTSLTFTSQYISNGESKTDTSTLGAYVSGDVNLVLYDVGINQIGNSLYVVGNILNQGSATGKFANIEIVSALPESPFRNKQSTQPQETLAQNNPEAFGQNNPRDPGQNYQNQTLAPQYLGDLNEDSSIPFSIPLPIRSLSPGTYPFTFKITYADDLKNFHEIKLDQQVKVNQLQQFAGGNQRQGAGSPNELSSFIIISLAGGSAAVAIVVVKKRKFPKLKFNHQNNLNDDDDIEKLLDSSKTKQNNNTEK